MEYFNFDQASEKDRIYDDSLSPFGDQDQAGSGPCTVQFYPEALDHLDARLSTSCPESLDDGGMPVTVEDTPAFDDFAHWIPRYVKPDAPFSKAASPGLGGVSEGHRGIDTLHGVSEDAVRAAGALTGTRAMRSTEAGAVEPRPYKGGVRFSREAVRVLKKWLADHANHPYPTDEEKDALKAHTGLKRSQIANWLANARRRGKVLPPRARSPCAGTPCDTAAIAIPTPRGAQSTLQDMNPLERWKHSPPEHEPASLPAIANAVARSTYPADRENSSSSSSWADHHRGSSTGSSFSAFGAPSWSSLETGQSSGSDFSFGSAFSHQSQQSFGSMELLKKKERRRRRRPAAARAPESHSARMFQCTFCTDTFKTKHDWQRHEKSLHLSIETWTCAPMGGVVKDSLGEVCVFCKTVNPAPGHSDTHNYDECCEKSAEERAFYRKDHLRQHLRLMHSCAFDATMESWKSTSLNVTSRCGFCGEVMNCWLWRVDHLAAHFRAGAKMADWKGDWGFEPHIVALLEDAMPPWMIDWEGRTPHPFSATGARGGHTAAPLSELAANDTAVMNDTMCYKRFEALLGAWTKVQLAQGTWPSEQMLQHQGRMVLFGSGDAWDQTPADDKAWLEGFKQNHGLTRLDGMGETALDHSLSNLGLGSR
ncbi:MAG: hypothetical protein M1833_000393 [Piccolia ochrophora]|nr:MAG: hypothetical protein M1833_000393 [Piccolia ochrophora]